MTKLRLYLVCKNCRHEAGELVAYVMKIEKKNAELKKRNTALKGICTRQGKDAETIVIKYHQLKKEYVKLKNRMKSEHEINAKVNNNLTFRLSKAKEHIKNLLSAYTTYADSFDDRDNEIVEEACQFISEVEK